MNIHDHYEPDAPTHEEREHGLFIIDVPLTYHERIEHAAQHGDMRAAFELFWLEDGMHIPDRFKLAEKAWLWNTGPAGLAQSICTPLQCEPDNKWMAWYVFTSSWAVETVKIELEKLTPSAPAPQPDQTQRTAFEAAVEETPGFAAWWDKDGSGIPKCEWHDAEEHAHKVALFAYRAGMEQAKGGAA